MVDSGTPAQQKLQQELQQKLTELQQQKLTELQQQIDDQNLELTKRQDRITELSASQKEENMTTQNHEGLLMFDPGRDQSMVGDRWEKWLEVWRLYLAYQKLDVKGNDGEYVDLTLKPLFLTKIGEEAREVYNGKCNAEKTDKLTTIINFMSEHYKPKRSIFAYVSIFCKAKRFEGETVNEYVTRLRLLAKPCKFEKDLDKELLRAFVFGCGIGKVEEMMASKDDKSLADAIECGLKNEHQMEDLKQIRAVHTQNTASGGTINQVNRNYNPTQQKGCGWCGKEQHARQQCPAKEKTCNKCGLIGHYGSVCRKSKTDQTTSQNGQNKKYSGHSSKQDSKMARSNTISAIKQSNSYSPAQTGTKSGSSKIHLDAQEYDEYQRYKRWSEWEDYNGMNMVLDGYKSTDPNTLTKVSINGSLIKVMVDTGAAVNAISELVYNGLANKPKLNQLVSPIYGFGNPSTPLKTLGVFNTNLGWKSSVVDATVVVMSGNKHQNLIGRRTAVELGMVTLNLGRSDLNQIVQVTELSKTELVKRYPKLFSGKLGCAIDTEIKLEVDKTVKPVKQPLRPIAFHYREAVEKELDKQVAEGILEKVEFGSKPITWISNLVVVPKDKAVSKQSKNLRPSDLSVRLTCDARPVNKALIRTRYPMKTMDDMIVAVNGATTFSKLDLNKAFHQIMIAEESRPLTTITTHKGLYWYKRLHMGIASASEMFTEKIREMLVDLPGQLNMTDDILVFGKSKEDHQANLLAVLKRLEMKGLTLNIDKSEFYKKELTFFGLRFTSKGVSPTEDRVRGIMEVSAPANLKELHSFLCSITWSSRFIKDLCTISEPLWKLTKANVKWKWEKVEQEAFDKLKLAITMDCASYFNIGWETVLTVDASPVGLAAVIHQYNPDDPNQKHWVGCVSRMLSEVERRYSQCEKEALGVVWACERLWMYLLGKLFTIETDNRAVKLIFANTRSRPPARIERLALKLSQFDYVIVHKPGISNIADYYSRHPIKPTKDEFMEEVRASAEAEMYINAITHPKASRSVTLDEIRAETANDKDLQLLIKLMVQKNGWKELPKQLLCYKHVFDELNTTQDGIVLRGQNIVIPMVLRERIADLAHIGHQGIVKTKRLIRSRVWYPGIDSQIEQRVKRCRECQIIDSKRQYAPLVPSEMPAGAWQKVSADFFGPMPDGKYWFVNSCDYSKWVDVTRIRSVSFDCVEPVLSKLFNKIGIPLEYKTDNGSPFQSHDFDQFAKKLGFKHRLVTPYWPRANATAENVMRKLNRALKIAKLENRNPDTVLNEFLAAYHDTPHTATNVAPNMLMFGYARTSGLPILDNSNKRLNYHRIAQEQHKQYAERMKTQFDRQMKVVECPIQVGDRVLCKQTIASKSDSSWDPNPFVVTGIKGSMIEASRTYPKQSKMVRNSSFFKVYKGWSEMDDVASNEPVQSNPVLTTPSENVVPNATPVLAGPSTPETASEPTAEPAVTYGPGRPNKERAAAMAKQKEDARASKIVSNPPVRQSERLLNKRNNSISAICHLEGGRYCVQRKLDSRRDFLNASCSRRI